MKEVSLEAVSRQAGNKGHARRSRMEGRIPAVVYGPEVTPYSVAVDERALRKAVKEAHGMNAIFNLSVDGKQNKTIIRDVQRDPITSSILHIDFHAISMTKPLHISIPIHFTGLAKGVKSDGGIMQIIMREVEISCLPVSIPEFLDVNVSELGIGDSIHVRDINIPDATILADPGQTIVVVVAPTVIKVETTGDEAAATTEGAAAPAAEGAAAPAGDKKPAPEKK